MPQDPDRSTVDRLTEIVDRLSRQVDDIRRKEDTRDLLERFVTGELDKNQIVNELLARYQAGIGGAFRALAEHDKAAAHQLGERLRSGMTAFLAELTSEPAPAQIGPAETESLKDRADAVLQREYLLMKLLAGTNKEIRSGTLFEAVRSFDTHATDQVITAQLSRLVKAGRVGHERKGRYHGLSQGDGHLTAVKREIEARGLALPPLPRLPAD